MVKTYFLSIGGMGCMHCVDGVTRALTEAGFAPLSCEIGSARISTELESDAAEKAVRAALDEAGYELLGMTVE